MKKSELRVAVESYIATHTVTPLEAEKLAKRAKCHFSRHKHPRSVREVHEAMDRLQMKMEDEEVMITIFDGSTNVAVFTTIPGENWSESLEAELDASLKAGVAALSRIFRRHGIEDSPLRSAQDPRVKDNKKKFRRLIEGLQLPEDDQPAS